MPTEGGQFGRTAGGAWGWPLAPLKRLPSAGRYHGMRQSHEVVCFSCGQPVGDPPRLNTTPGGDNCPACAERLLESLPGVFHAPVAIEAVATQPGVVEGADQAQGAEGGAAPARPRAVGDQELADS